MPQILKIVGHSAINLFILAIHHISGQMNRRRQFSLATLMLATTGVAVVLAISPYPFFAYYLLLAVFFGAAILFRMGPVESRSFWRWFSLSGWIYIIAGLTLLETIESTTLWSSIETWLRRTKPSPHDWNPNHYLMTAHMFIALGVAISGGLLIPALRARMSVSQGTRTANLATDAPQEQKT